jgi:predicted signal transduction protein with EAL and GGDEF domain
MHCSDVWKPTLSAWPFPFPPWTTRVRPASYGWLRWREPSASPARAQRIAGEDVYIDFSAGASVFPDDTQDAEALLGAALQAQRLSRSQSGNQKLYFHRELSSSCDASALSLEAHLQQALQKDQFFLVYQPQQHLAGGHISGAEALLRWRHASRGVISPNDLSGQ